MMWYVTETGPIIITKTNITINRVEGKKIGDEVLKPKIEMFIEEKKFTNLDKVVKNVI